VFFMADPFDIEPHGRVLWFRAMMGEYGPIKVLNEDRPLPPLTAHSLGQIQSTKAQSLPFHLKG
jgi:hypothetical protein